MALGGSGFFVETTFTAGRLLQPLLSPHRHLLLPQVPLDLDLHSLHLHSLPVFPFISIAKRCS